MPQGRPDGFEWDYDKQVSNLEKHFIDFRDAVRIFDGPVVYAPRIGCGELRVAATGEVEGVAMTVVYTVRGKRFRIISARAARDKEYEAYNILLALRASKWRYGLE